MKPSKDSLQQAMRLMQAGDLHAATRAIQRGLAGNAGNDLRRASTPARDDACIDVEFRVVDEAEAPLADVAAGRVRARENRGRATARPRAAAIRPLRRPVPAAWRQDGVDANDPCFRRHRFTCTTGDLDYKLYIPAGLDTTRAPLLLMLHGCTQTPDDFARGTRMNQHADEHGYVVAWPAQSIERNQNRCWNWFRGSDQQRGSGEPAILAALTRHLLATHALDPERVYVAGLSAGGAMAAVLASTHPDLYAAIGVHSGLPIGLASDLPSAFAAMRKGGARARRRPDTAASVPAIVFHGDVDSTVHPGNGEGVIAQSLGADHATRTVDGVGIERGSAAGGRQYTRTVHRSSDGRIAAEHWLVHGAAHAWSGGDAIGSYTDPAGPDASAEILRFFAGCRRRASD